VKLKTAKDELTPRQMSVLSFLKDHLEKKGYPPTVREIAGHFKMRGPKGAQKHLNSLVRKGLIRKPPGLSRAIEVIGRPSGSSQSVAFPVVGRVRAGDPLLAVEQVEEYLHLDRRLVPALNRPAGDAFILRVTGNSMIEAGIREGDYALVQPDPQPRNGDIVVALLNDEATVKRFYKDRNSIRLEPANAHMKPIVIKPDQEAVRILGKVVAIIRKL
jgi:repressor LexA